MASPSTQLQDGASLTSGSSSWKYDVFLSFSGEDTRYGFVDHLYSVLHEKVIFTFKDDQRLERGESIFLTLMNAIENSRFVVVVFSENYTSSKWCLEELVYILECQKTRGLTILPVFYKVDPSDLRKQRGSVGEAFTRHERDSSEEKVKRWRNALVEASNISGWDSKTHRAEAKLVRDIAIDILNRLRYNVSSVLEDVVGLYPHIAEVMSRLEMELDLDDPRVVGICGMGGIGKTTIAQAVYHQIHSQFDASGYCESVRKTPLQSLQKSLLAHIHSVSYNDIKIENTCRLGQIRNAIRNKRVLVFLDDVDNSAQLDALVGKLDWFGPGSRIIITTRDSHLLAVYGPRSHVYNVKGLDDEEAFKLFCYNAFSNNQPMPGFEHLIKSAIHYAQGVPLALKVLGRLLMGKELNVWESLINGLRKEPNSHIQKVLQLSYDGLECQEKKIFLDIACFFTQYRIEYNTVVTVLDACYFSVEYKISVLQDNALVTIRDNMIGMHDLIQEKGWHIVNEESPEPGKRSKLWKYEDIYHTLTEKKGTEAVETIVLNPDKTKEISLSSDAFSKMSRLRLLKLSDVWLRNGRLNYLSNDLRLLDWHGYPSKYLPPNFKPNNLVNLTMTHSCLQQPWNKRMARCLNKLKNVDFSYSPSIAKVPEFTHVTNLTKLSFEECTNLVKIDPSIEAIKGLAHLNLSGCKYLEVLFTGCWLNSVEELNLYGCSKLKNVSEVLAFAKYLIEVDVSETCVKELPVEHLSNLEDISAQDCKELVSIPSGICGLKRLHHLDLNGCSKLSELPEGLGELESLVYLCVSHTAIKQLPPSIAHLKKLCTLSCVGCNRGVTSATRSSLFSSCLIPKECQDVVGFELPPLSGLSSLAMLHLHDSILREGLLPDDLGSLSSLKYLILDDSNIISLPASIRGLYKLEWLHVADCKKLKSLQYLPKNIKEIFAYGCTSLETFSDPPILFQKLSYVDLRHCHTLLKNRPSLPLELLRNHFKVDFGDRRGLHIAVPGTEIPKWFSNQSNTRHYVRIQLMPGWYQGLRGFALCAVSEATNPLITGHLKVECRCMHNDVVVCRRDIHMCSHDFQSGHLFLEYTEFSEIGQKKAVNDLKTWTEIIFYFKNCGRAFKPYSSKHDPWGEFGIANCAVHMVYENDEEWSDPRASI